MSVGPACAEAYQTSMSEETEIAETEIKERLGARDEDEDAGNWLARLRANKALRSAVRAFLLGLVSFGPTR